MSNTTLIRKSAWTFQVDSFKSRTANSSLKTVQNCVVGVSFQQGHFSTGKDYEIRKKSSCRKMTPSIISTTFGLSFQR